MVLGLRILPRLRKASAAQVSRSEELPTACVSDCMGRLAGAGPRLRPLHASGPLAGPALTVKVRPGDNLMIHKALMLLEPGDVLVVDGGGDLTNALMGELMLSYARARGAAGVVVNGAVRDCGWIGAQRFPVFAAGVTHWGPYKDGPGEINAPLGLDGMRVDPGDLILGDEDGVACIPIDHIDAVIAAAIEKREEEAGFLRRIEAGDLDPKAWVDVALRARGCEEL